MYPVPPWPECALIVIAPRPRDSCCAGVSCHGPGVRLLDYTPPVLGEMHRCIRVLPWPECALIVIAPRPRDSCCAGVSGCAAVTGLR